MQRIYLSGDCSGTAVRVNITRQACAVGPLQACGVHPAGSVRVDCEDSYPAAVAPAGDLQTFSPGSFCQGEVQEGLQGALGVCVATTASTSELYACTAGGFNVTRFSDEADCTGRFSWIFYGSPGCIVDSAQTATCSFPSTTTATGTTASGSTTTSSPTTAPLPTAYDVSYYFDTVCGTVAANPTATTGICYNAPSPTVNQSAVFTAVSASQYQVVTYDCSSCGCASSATLTLPTCSCQQFMGAFTTFSVCAPGDSPAPPTPAPTTSAGTATTVPAWSHMTVPSIGFALVGLLAAWAL